MLYLGRGTLESLGIVFSRQIADQRCDSMLLAKKMQQFFEKTRLARPWARHKTCDIDARQSEALSQAACEEIILFEHLGPDFDETGRPTHANTSKAPISSSYPRTTLAAKLQRGHASCCID